MKFNIGYIIILVNLSNYNLRQIKHFAQSKCSKYSIRMNIGVRAKKQPVLLMHGHSYGTQCCHRFKPYGHLNGVHLARAGITVMEDCAV